MCSCATAPIPLSGATYAQTQGEVIEASVRLKDDPALRQLITWRQAVALVRSKSVKFVMQNHNCKVFLWGKDNRTYETTEPRIDEIERVLEELGPDRAGIMYATE
jgi:hypothetical protein